MPVPQVYLEQVTPSPKPALETGVPVFVGLVEAKAPGLFDAAGLLAMHASTWSTLEARWGTAWIGGSVGFAVRGFFENGGQRCHVVAPRQASYGGSAGQIALARLADGLDALSGLDDFDLVCAPDLAMSGAEALIQGQSALVDFCRKRTGCFAILDAVGSAAPSSIDVAAITAHADSLAAALDAGAMGASGALYGPWIKVRGACPQCGGEGTVARAVCSTCWGTGAGFIPPSGHVAGVYARADRRAGVYKAPANEAISGAQDVQVAIDNASQAKTDASRLNAIRGFPGRGIRIWGARTLSKDPAWAYVSVRRLFLTLSRWLELAMVEFTFEPNDLKLWIRIQRTLGVYLADLFRSGALQGKTADEAYYVKCDDETNPPEIRDRGQVVAEVGVAAASPNEFIIVRLVGGAGKASATTADTSTEEA
ncbi:Phage tail sheath protein FI [Minicystis rosea]|nr:Phage tail sheath protein FI [Minicystis rosea]